MRIDPRPCPFCANKELELYINVHQDSYIRCPECLGQVLCPPGVISDMDGILRSLLGVWDSRCDDTEEDI